MPSYLTPGVYVEEQPSAPGPIEGVPTSNAVFVGLTSTAQAEIPLVTSYSDFEWKVGTDEALTVGGTAVPNYLAHAARAFFAEGGERLQILGVAVQDGAMPVSADWDAALARVSEIADVTIIAAPGAIALTDPGLSINDRLIATCARQQGLFALLDPPSGLDPASVETLRAAYDSPDAALYYPWIETTDSVTGQPLLQPPSGFVAGIFARSDAAHGVGKAPANEVINSATGLEHLVNKAEQDILNPLNINCIRRFDPDHGIRVWGARTLSSDSLWSYISTRRLMTYLERSLEVGLAWSLFELNAAPLWTRITAMTQDFLSAQWRAGLLQGATPKQAFYVRCDSATMTQDDINEGRVVLEIGVAALRPAEFINVRIGLLASEQPSAGEGQPPA